MDVLAEIAKEKNCFFDYTPEIMFLHCRDGQDIMRIAIADISKNETGYFFRK